VSNIASAIFDEGKSFFQRWPFSFPCRLTFGNEDSLHWDALRLAPVLTTLLLCWQVQFIPLLLLCSRHAAVDDSGRSSLISLTVVLGHEIGILQEAEFSDNVTTVLLLKRFYSSQNLRLGFSSFLEELSFCLLTGEAMED
jgi:hypothetical protein